MWPVWRKLISYQKEQRPRIRVKRNSKRKRLVDFIRVWIEKVGSFQFLTPSAEFFVFYTRWEKSTFLICHQITVLFLVVRYDLSERNRKQSEYLDCRVTSCALSALSYSITSSEKKWKNQSSVSCYVFFSRLSNSRLNILERSHVLISDVAGFKLNTKVVIR